MEDIWSKIAEAETFITRAEKVAPGTSGTAVVSKVITLLTRKQQNAVIFEMVVKASSGDGANTVGSMISNYLERDTPEGRAYIKTFVLNALGAADTVVDPKEFASDIKQILGPEQALTGFELRYSSVPHKTRDGRDTFVVKYFPVAGQTAESVAANKKLL